ncbi:hypothetical protein R75465_08531 [Paraburkholderia aspalathi]|nr:hypothetical protein R75465_08531 [Paraburkholderia aspalathi]
MEQSGDEAAQSAPLSSYPPRNTLIRLMFHASATSDHSAVTLDSPRSENCRNPITCLMMPNTGSTVFLRSPYRNFSS